MDEGTGTSARDRTDSWRRKESSGGSDRSVGGGRQRVPSVSSARQDSFARGSSGRTEVFSRASSVMRKEEAAVSATGGGSASAALAIADEGGGTRNPETMSEQQGQHHCHKVLGLFGNTHASAVEAGSKAGAPPSDASASGATASDAAAAAAASKNTGVEITKSGHGAAVAVDSMARGNTAAASTGAEKQGFRAILRRDNGRVRMLGADEVEKGQGDGEERMEVEPSPCKDLGRDSDNWAVVGSPVRTREEATDEDGREKKNADFIIPATAAADSDVMDRHPLEQTSGAFKSADTASDDNSEALATAGSSSKETGRRGASGGSESAGSTRTNSNNDKNDSNNPGVASPMVVDNTDRGDASPMVSDNADPGVASLMVSNSLRVRRRERGDALYPERRQLHRIIHESNHEQGASGDLSITAENRPETAAAGLGAGATSSSLEYSECDADIGPPDLSPSAAPPNRRQGSLLMMSSFGGSSRSSRRETGKIAGGSAMSTWSTNSPSPVFTDEVVGGADED